MVFDKLERDFVRRIEYREFSVHFRFKTAEEGCLRWHTRTIFVAVEDEGEESTKNHLPIEVTEDFYAPGQYCAVMKGKHILS